MSAAIITPPVKVTPSTEVPVTIGLLREGRERGGGRGWGREGGRGGEGGREEGGRGEGEGGGGRGGRKEGGRGRSCTVVRVVCCYCYTWHHIFLCNS